MRQARNPTTRPARSGAALTAPERGPAAPGARAAAAAPAPALRPAARAARRRSSSTVRAGSHLQGIVLDTASSAECGGTSVASVEDQVRTTEAPAGRPEIEVENPA